MKVKAKVKVFWPLSVLFCSNMCSSWKGSEGIESTRKMWYSINFRNKGWKGTIRSWRMKRVRETWESQIFTKSNCSSFSAKFQLRSWECSKGKVRISRERRTFDYPHFSTAPVRSQPYQKQMTMCSCYENCNVSYFLFLDCSYIGRTAVAPMKLHLSRLFGSWKLVASILQYTYFKYNPCH